MVAAGKGGNRRMVVVLLAALLLLGALIALTTTDLHLGVSEKLMLQRPGIYPVPDGDGTLRFMSGRPYVPQYHIFAVYVMTVVVLTSIAITRIATGRRL